MRLDARVLLMTAALLGVWATGCRSARDDVGQPGHDRPFPLGQVTDAIWETQQTNAEASDFVFYDHEFVGETAELAPAAKDKLMQVALRLEHVPFPVVVERSPENRAPGVDRERRRAVVGHLARLGTADADKRVVIAPALARGITAVEGERGYYSTIYNGFGAGGGSGRRFGGSGGYFR